MTKLNHSLVQGLKQFQGIAAEVLDEILAKAQLRRIPKGGKVFHQGQSASEFYVLLRGKLRVTLVSPTGRQLLLRYVVEGEIFGVAKALGRSDYPGTVDAVLDSVLLAWPSDCWNELVSKVPQFALNTLQTVGQRLQEANTRLGEIATEEVEARVAHALLRLIRQAGRKADGGIGVDFPISRRDIAELTGATMHTVSRVLSAWEAAGLVESGRQRVVVKNAAALERLAERKQDKI
jgi:CRP-like cAMP-binding protein